MPAWGVLMLNARSDSLLLHVPDSTNNSQNPTTIEHIASSSSKISYRLSGLLLAVVYFSILHCSCLLRVHLRVDIAIALCNVILNDYVCSCVCALYVGSMGQFTRQFCNWGCGTQTTG